MSEARIGAIKMTDEQVCRKADSSIPQDVGYELNWAEIRKWSPLVQAFEKANRTTDAEGTSKPSLQVAPAEGESQPEPQEWEAAKKAVIAAHPYARSYFLDEEGSSPAWAIFLELKDTFGGVRWFATEPEGWLYVASTLPKQCKHDGPRDHIVNGPEFCTLCGDFLPVPKPVADSLGEPQEYRKTATITAVRFTHDMAMGNQPLPSGVLFSSRSCFPADNKLTAHHHYIDTLEGRMRVELGDWIATGVKGEHWSIKDDVFALSYELASKPLPAQPEGRKTECSYPSCHVTEGLYDCDLGSLCGTHLAKSQDIMADERRKIEGEQPSHPRAFDEQAERGKDGVALIAAERERQIGVEGWTPEHDARNSLGEMQSAAADYLAECKRILRKHDVSQEEEETGMPWGWPWAKEWWKPSPDPVRNLVKAGALIAAEIDRLQARAVQGEAK